MKTRNGIRNEKKHFSTKNVVDSDQKTFLNLTKSFDLNCSTSSYGGKSNSNVEEKTKFERKILVNKVCLYSLFTRVQLKYTFWPHSFVVFTMFLGNCIFQETYISDILKIIPLSNLANLSLSLSLSLSVYHYVMSFHFQLI